MAKPKKPLLPQARLPKGMRDVEAHELRGLTQMLDTIRRVYDLYGFEPLETPAFEYTECLGKFLPDQDRPNAGVFSFQDEDEQWLSLRYDLTAPLARYVAEQGDRLAKPFRRYAVGPVWRNEKPGPGRYRQFTQFDADIVGTDTLTADAEICMLAADTLEALGLAGKFIIRVNNRKVLDGIIESVGIAADDTHTRLAVLRSLDKLDKFSREDVALLLGPGRKDESGDFTKGAGLSDSQVGGILAFVTDPEAAATNNTTARYQEGMAELDRMGQLLLAAGYAEDRVKIDYSVVRGLEYYTGPVFEAELTFEVTGDDGQPVRFGSVGGGGRYDDLVARFTGQPMPATGFSIGVSRLYAALNAIGANRFATTLGPVVVLVMDKKEPERYQAITQSLRHAGIRAEMYLGTAGMKPQMKYADRRGAPAVIIEGSDEREQGIITIKDLIEGARAAETITDRGTWTEERPAQFTVAFDQLIPAIRDLLARHQPKA